jgi:hypothetical protein
VPWLFAVIDVENKKAPPFCRFFASNHPLPSHSYFLEFLRSFPGAMALLDDLLNSSDPFEDSPPPPPPNSLNGLEIHSPPPSENGDNQFTIGNSTNNNNNQSDFNENGRRPRRDSESDPEEEARIARRSFMEVVMDRLNIQGTACERGRDFADVSVHILVYLLTILIHVPPLLCSLPSVNRSCNFMVCSFLTSLRSITWPLQTLYAVRCLK